MFEFRALLRRLTDHGVQYVVVGGVAASLHRSPLGTMDVDVCARLDDDNLQRILDALRDVRPRLRMRPDRMPLPDDVGRLRGIRNLYLQTEIGTIDVLSEITGVGTFDDLAGKTVEMDLGGFTARVLDLDTLIESKRAAGRAKDVPAVHELEAIRMRRRNNPGLWREP
jgi:predicted nucleotidyltransferase